MTGEGPLVGPVEDIDTGSVHPYPEEGIALCLSGGGYRAALFHVGSLWRLHETGILQEVKRISSVSGGSITAGVLGLNWHRIYSDRNTPTSDFVANLVDPIRGMTSVTIDASAIIGGILLPGAVSDKIINAFRKRLFGEATLQDLPDAPRFVINATNVQSGALWRFMKPYMRDYRVGEVKNPRVLLAAAVAASAAFPPVLSPLEMELDPSDFTPNTGLDLQEEPYTSQVVLSDGGVYDNLGLETAWKRYSTILVSDAGGKLQPEAEPKTDWARHSYRVLELVDNQVRSLRKRSLIDSYEKNLRDGTYWGIRTNIDHYNLADALPCDFQKTLSLANTPTRLKRLPNIVQERLINWGYAVCDAAIRRHYAPTLSRPSKFPYEHAGVG